MEVPVRAIIIAGGQSCAEDERHLVQEGDLIIGADGGAARALAWGLAPDLVIGDMDSLGEEEQKTLATKGCQFVVHPRAKDETDLELALTYAAQEPVREILILGALGGRLDHTVANLLLLTLPELEGISVRIIAGGGQALLVRSGEAATLEGSPGDLVSLLPLGGDVHGVTTSGLTWRLQGDTLRFGLTRGVSNELTEPVARIEVGSGYLLVVHTPLPGTGD
jgi:thiamine pyrophosphokinase